MDRSILPSTAFIAPGGTPEVELESWLDRALRDAVRHLRSAEDRPPLPDAEVSRAAMDAPVLPDAPAPADALLDEAAAVRRLVRGHAEPDGNGAGGAEGPDGTEAPSEEEVTAALARLDLSPEQLERLAEIPQ